MKKQLFITTFCTLLLAGYGCSSPQVESQPKDLTQYVDPYMTTVKTIALTRRTLVGKVMSLLLNMLSRLVII